MFRNSYVEDLPYEGLIGHSLRIGDTLFYVPPTSVKVQHQMSNERVPLMRARHSVVKNSGYFNKLITLTLYFPNRDSINNELRPLLAQVQKCPFLPIENQLLNDQHGIEAVTISNINTQTIPGFPHCLVATIQCNAFDPATYIYDGSDRSYAQMFNWPLFRWFYKRSLMKNNGVTYYKPMYTEMDNEFSFRIANEEQLAKLKELKEQKREKIQSYNKERADKLWGAEKLEEEFFEDMDDNASLVDAIGEIEYDTVTMTGLHLTSFSAMAQHNLTNFQLQMDESPGQQYLGSQETMYIAEFETKDEDVVAILSGLVHQTAKIARDYNKFVKGAILQFSSQITELFGNTFITIEDISFIASADHRGVHKISLTMVGANKMGKKSEEVKWLTKDAEWDIGKYDGVTVFGSIQTPLRILGQPSGREIIQNIKNLGKDLKLDSNAAKRVAYESHVKESMRTMELYPDLELPTYEEVEAAGFNIPNPMNGYFVDPDFFIDYTGATTSENAIMTHLKESGAESNFRDETGGSASGAVGKIPDKTNPITEKQINQTNLEKEPVPNETNIEHDEKNITKAQADALVRKKADDFKIDENVALALSQTMDPKMRQFYEKGMNIELGHRKETRDGIPSSMDQHLTYTYGTDGDSSGTRYYGIMKVPSIITNSEGVAFNIKTNIHEGVQLLKNELNDMSRTVRTADKNGYDLDRFRKVFGIEKSKGNKDEKAIINAGAFMKYFGLDSELNDLLKTGKAPNPNTIKLVKKYLLNIQRNVSQGRSTDEQLEQDLKDLNLKDMRSENPDIEEDTVTPYSGSGMDVSKKELMQDMDNGMMFDATYYDRRGRLVRAFPTFLMMFIDEGKYVGAVKLSDQFYQYQPVKDIMYVNNRKNASSSLYVELSNVYGTLSDSEAAMNVSNTTYRETLQMLTLPGLVAQDAERTRNRWQQYHKNIFLTSGVRIHFRMGYSANALALPTIMNGTITSLQNGEESLSIVVQDDGYELANKLRVQADEETGGFIFARKEPTEIIDEILSDSQGLFKNVKALISNEEYNFHSLGIMHFGSPGMPQGLAQLKGFIGGAAGGAATGAAGGAAAGAMFGGVGAIPGSLIGAIGGSLAGGMAIAKQTNSDSEIMQNVYSTNGLTGDGEDDWWNNLGNALGIGKYDEDNISMDLYDKSVWDVMTTCSYLGPDFILAVHPFDFRNTIFMGRQYFPLKYGYTTNDEGEAQGILMKPFKQLHTFDSYTSIIGNTIKATEDNIRTVAIGSYMDNGEIATTEPVYADIHMWPEKQRVVNVDTTMNAKGIRILDKVPLVGKYMNKPFKWKFDKGVALKITAAQLRDYLKDMYDGYVTVLGYPAIKPFDGFYLNDTFNDMSGQMDVKEVTQIMNYDVGFITMIKPDLVVANRDKRLMTLANLGAQMATKFAATAIINKVLRSKGFAGSSPLVTALWGLGKGSLNKAKQRKEKMKGYIDKITKEKTSAAEVEEDKNRRSQSKGSEDVISKNRKNGKLKKLLKVAEAERLLGSLINGGNKGVQALKNTKLSKKMTTLLGSGKSWTKLKAGAKIGKYALMLSNPVGIVAKAIEFLIVDTTLGTIGEMINRKAMTSQAVLMAPIQRGGIEFSAGINGHHGSVIGDSPTAWRRILSGPVGQGLGWLLRFDPNLWAAADDVETSKSQAVPVTALGNKVVSFAQQASSKKDKTYAQTVDGFIQKNRKLVLPTSDNKSNEKMYEAERNALKGYSDRREKQIKAKPDYKEQEEKVTWEKMKKKFKDWIFKAFDYIKDFVKKMIEKFIKKDKKDTDARDCSVSKIKRGGKAINLSSGMKYLGPIIEKECKDGGIPQFTELMKAMCMVESSGNYKRTPDCMQSSESAGHGMNYFTTPQQSIHQAVIALKATITTGQHKCDDKVYIQAYNYGPGFAKYALNNNGGRWSYKTAKDFACKMRPGSCRYGNDEYIFRLAQYYKMPGGNGDCDNKKDKKENNNNNGGKGKGKDNKTKPNQSKNVIIGVDVAPNKDYTAIAKEITPTTNINVYSTMLTREKEEAEVEYENINIEMAPEVFKTTKDDAMHRIESKELNSVEYENILFNPINAYKDSVLRFHRGTVYGLGIAAQRLYNVTGEKLEVAGGFLKGHASWLGTGWGVEIAMPNGLKIIGGKSRYDEGTDKELAYNIVESMIVGGFKGLTCGDYDIVQRINSKYGKDTIQYTTRRKTLRCNYVT